MNGDAGLPGGFASPGETLITGGCGFVGANLVRVPSERSLVRSVRVVDDESQGRNRIAPHDVELVSLV